MNGSEQEPQSDSVSTSHTSRDTIPPAGLADSQAKPGDAASAIPSKLGRYSILRCLGTGGMGAVYLAQDEQLDRQVALKVPTAKVAGSPKQLERLYREARSAATLNHPNICSVFDVGEIDGRHYISMAYIDGRPLSDFVRPDKLLPERQAAALVRRIALALQHAHEQGVIHRDLKPSNIMIDPRRQPIVMDFGLARQVGSDSDIRLTRQGAVLGSPAYMSPEQVEGDLESIGPASDIYSLGVLLYELLTAELPFSGSMASVMGQILTRDPISPSEIRPDLSFELEPICLQMMARDIVDRYASMKQVADVLGSFLKQTRADQSAIRESAELPAFDGIDEEYQFVAPRRTAKTNARWPAPGRTFWIGTAAAGVTVALCVWLALTFTGSRRGPAEGPSSAGSFDQLAADALTKDQSEDFKDPQVNQRPQVEHRAITQSSPSPAAPSQAVPAVVAVERLVPKPFTIKPDPALIPEHLRGASVWDFPTKVGTSKANGVLRFRVLQSGEVYLLAHWKSEGGRSPDWYNERLTKEQLRERGWDNLGPCAWDPDIFLFKKTVKQGERYVIRTNKYWPPKLIIRREGGSARSGSPPPAIAPFDVAQARQHQQAWADHLGTSVQTTNSIGMKLKLIPAGEFQMGSPDSEPGRGKNETQHLVTLTKPFYLGVVEVTQAQWHSIMKTRPWSGQPYVKAGGAYAATYVNWNNATEFCRKLSEREQRIYRLPTEAEWEYACRAGTTTRFSCGDSVSALGGTAWYSKNAYEVAAQRYAHPGALKKVNGWGLHDMHGNVWEWCQDRFAAYSSNHQALVDPAGPAIGQGHVLRGGSFMFHSQYSRSANRTTNVPGYRYAVFKGLRVACSVRPVANSLPRAVSKPEGG